MSILLQSIGGATDAVRAAVEDVGIDHCCSDVAVAEQVGGKGMAKAVRGGRFVDACSMHGASNCFLNQARIKMMSALLPGFSIAPALVLREHPLPVHLPIGVLVFTGKCSG